MSKHAGIIGRINIKERSVNAFLKSPQAKPLIESITQVILKQTEDCYVLRYDKKMSVLSIFIYYKYANHEKLRGDDFKALFSLCSFFTADTSGYLIGFKDILNIHNNDIIYAYEIDKQLWQLNETMPTKERLYEVSIQHSQHFNLLAKGQFYKYYAKAHLMPPLLTLVKKQLQAAKKINFYNALANASLSNTLLLFGHYYYNGRWVYTTRARLDEIDIRSFVQTKYGGADADHVVVGDCVYKTDPSQFKQLFANYYSLSGKLFYYCYVDNALIEIKGACPKSFKNHGLWCEDDNAIYFKKQRIEKSRLSNYRIYPDSGNFTKLFISQAVAYFENTQMNLALIDVDSFEFVQYFEQSGVADIIEAIDKKGKMILILDKITQEVDIKRDDSFIAQILTEFRDLSKLNHASYIDSPEFQQHFIRHKKDPDLFTAILGYFSACEKEYRTHTQTFALQKIISCYEIIKERVYCAPDLYPYIIKAYALLGDDQNTLITIKHAIIAGFSKMSLIWQSSWLMHLYTDPIFQKMKYFDEHRMQLNDRPVASLQFIEWLNKLSDDELIAYQRAIFSHHYFPSLQEMLGYRNDAAFRNINLDLEAKPSDWENYIISVQRIIARLFIHADFNAVVMQYETYAQHGSVPISIHLAHLNLQFSQLHILGNMSGKLNLLPLLQRIETINSMIAQQPETQKQAALTSLKSNIVYRILMHDTPLA